MAMLVKDCPRCGSASITFDVAAQVYIGQEYGWVSYFEVFCICRNCNRPTIFIVRLRNHDAVTVFEKKGLWSLMTNL